MLRDRAAAEDLTQNVFAQAYAHREGLTDARRSKAWLFVVAANMAREHLRQARPAVAIDEAADLADATADVEGVVVDHELSQLVWTAAASLEDNQRLALDLRVRRGLSVGEVAQALEMTPRQASDLVARAHEGLRTAVRALLVRRQARSCVNLATLLVGAGETFTPEQRRTVDRHMRHCADCRHLADRLTKPSELFGGLVLLPLPPALHAFSPTWANHLPSPSAALHMAPAQTALLPPPALLRPPLSRRRAAFGIGGAVVSLAFLGGLYGGVAHLHSDTRPASLLPSPGPGAGNADAPAPLESPAAGAGAQPFIPIGALSLASPTPDPNAVYKSIAYDGYGPVQTAEQREIACVNGSPASSCVSALDGSLAALSTWRQALAAVPVPAGFASRDARLKSDLDKDIASRTSFRDVEASNNPGYAWATALNQLNNDDGLVFRDVASITDCLIYTPC
jgi:RNA polymerase sigma factor (sigma-70 family)